MNRSWAWYLVAGAALVATYVCIPPGLAAAAVYQVVSLSSIAAIAVGVARHRPDQRAPWLLIAAAQALTACGDGVWAYLDDVLHLDPYPSLADAFYISAYPCLVAALWSLVRRRSPGLDPAGLVDSAIVTVALALPVWVLLAGPVVTDGATVPLHAAVGFAYPLGDVLVLALLARLITSSGARTPAFAFLGAAAVTMPVADVLFSALGNDGALREVNGVLWMSATLMWGAAALHPSMRALTLGGGEDVSVLTGRRIALLLSAVLIAPGVLAGELLLDGTVEHGWAIVLWCVLLILLGMARMHLAMTAAVRSASQNAQLRQDLDHQASHDALTGLPNRFATLRLIDGAMHRATRNGSMLGLLALDIDDLRSVNDAHGQQVGDAVLNAVAVELRRHVRGGDTVGRLGSDEFVVLVESPTSEAALTDLAQSLTSLTVATASHTVALSTSVGVAVLDTSVADAHTFLRHAEVATAHAKVAGGAREWIFDDELRVELEERARMERAIREGLRGEEFVLHYQPVVEVDSLRTTGFEALIRWERPGHGRIAPDVFIPVAERSDLICTLGRWVLARACEQLAAWSAADVTVAVNLSGRHIARPTVVGDVATALAATGVPAHRLVIEITETVPLEDSVVDSNLRALRALGVGLSLDDFGTGYTSLRQLRRLPVTTLKIDRSFLSTVERADEALLGLLVHAAHAVDLKVIAEGVERLDQLEMLRSLGCDRAQGFLIAEPLPAERAEISSGHPTVRATAHTGAHPEPLTPADRGW